jgi:hypothetical protein
MADGVVPDPDDLGRGRRDRLDLEQAPLCHHRTARGRMSGAKQLGLSVPLSLTGRADEVIE